MKSREGFTLIEVIISIALITLISITFLGMFNMGGSHILKAGKRTKSILEVRELVDDKIRIYENKVDGIDEIRVTILGVVTDKSVKGTMIKESNPNKPNIEITTFVPKKKILY